VTAHEGFPRTRSGLPLTAIIAPGIARPGEALDISVHNGRLVAGAAAVLIAAATRNVLFTIADGFVVVWLVS
jgi:branched-subunit amino acid transport protein